MAIWIVCLLPSSEAQPFCLTSLGGGAVPLRDQRSCFHVQTETSLFFHRLVLVFGNAGAGERYHTGRRAGSRGSLHVPAPDRSVYSRDLVRCRHRLLVAPSTRSSRHGNGLLDRSLDVPAWKQTSYWRDGRALWTHALAVNPQNDTAHISLCDLDLRENRLDDAIFHARKALEIRPDSADAHSRLGVALSASGQNEEASIHFQKALETHQIRPRVHYNIATLLLNSGHLDEAIAEFQKELQIQPEFVEAHNNLGIALTSKGELDEALAHFQKALELDPHLPKVHHNIAMILLRQGQLDQAIAHLQKELQVNPASAEAHNDLGIAWSQQGRIDRGNQRMAKDAGATARQSKRLLQSRVGVRHIS